MSATNRGGVRATQDNYPTPELLVKALLPYRARQKIPIGRAYSSP